MTQMTGTWGCAMYYGDETGDEGKASALRESEKLAGATLRQMIRTSAGGSGLTLTFSNEYGQTDMELRSVRIARATVPGYSNIDAATDTAVTFGGGQSAAIPGGGRLTSDLTAFDFRPLERLAVSVHFGKMPRRVACHVGARANSFIKPGDAVSDGELRGDDVSVSTHWFALSNVDTPALAAPLPTASKQAAPAQAAPAQAAPLPGLPKTLPQTAMLQAAPVPSSIVVLGDSITDGFGVSGEQYTRWTDVLAERLQSDPGTAHLSVINMGIGTNCLLGQENPPAGERRFERDVLNQPGIGYFAFFIGVNDLAFTGAGAGQMTAAYGQMIDAALARGIKTCACTILPYSKTDPRRHEINNAMRRWHESGRVSMLLDFDSLLKDPGNPDTMLPVYDCDGLHPVPEAYRVMGEHAYDIIRHNDAIYLQNSLYIV